MPGNIGRRRVAVVAGYRTPFCKAGTVLKYAPAVDLARHAGRELLEPFMTLREDLKRVVARRSHCLEDLLDEVVRDVFMEQVGHAIDEN